MRDVHFMADITKLDAAAGTLTVKTAKGRVLDLKIAQPGLLDGYKAGDQVEGEFAQVLSIVALNPASRQQRNGWGRGVSPPAANTCETITPLAMRQRGVPSRVQRRSPRGHPRGWAGARDLGAGPDRLRRGTKRVGDIARSRLGTPLVPKRTSVPSDACRS